MAEENKTAEQVKQEQTVTAPPTAEVKPEQTSTTQEVKQEVAAKVEKPEGAGLPKGVEKRLYKLNAERRAWQEEAEKSRKELEELKKTLTLKQEEAMPSFIEDPEKRLALEHERMKKETLEAVRKERVTELRAEKLKAEGEKTISYVLEQPEINGDMDKMEEVDAIIVNSPELSSIFQISPMFAAKEALRIWKEGKGLNAEDKKIAQQEINAVKNSPAQSMSSIPKRTINEIRGDLQKIDPLTDTKYLEKYNKLMDELASLNK